MSRSNKVVSLFGLSLSTISFMSFFQALFQIWMGEHDTITLVSAIIVVFLIPVTINLANKGLDDGTAVKQVVVIAYCLVISLMLCGAYIVSCQVVIETPDQIFAFALKSQAQTQLDDFAPFAVITIMYALSVWLLMYFVNRIPKWMSVAVSCPILLMIGAVVLKYLGLGAFRDLWEASRLSSNVDDFMMFYLVAVSLVTLAVGVRCALVDPTRSSGEYDKGMWG